MGLRLLHYWLEYVINICSLQCLPEATFRLGTTKCSSHRLSRKQAWIPLVSVHIVQSRTCQLLTCIKASGAHRCSQLIAYLSSANFLPTVHWFPTVSFDRNCHPRSHVADLTRSRSGWFGALILLDLTTVFTPLITIFCCSACSRPQFWLIITFQISSVLSFWNWRKLNMLSFNLHYESVLSCFRTGAKVSSTRCGKPVQSMHIKTGTWINL